jgi:hypothetical protein
MAIEKFYKIITPGYATKSMSSSADVVGFGSINWYTRLVRGSYTRLKRYSEYDTMDADVDIARALDLIAEEMVGNKGKRDLPLDIHVDNEHYKVPTSTIVTLKSALRTWCRVQQWNSRLFGIARSTVKYGDTFFLRNNTGTFKKLIYVHPKHVNAAKVSVEDIYDIKEWEINLNFNDATASYGNQLLIPVNVNGEKEGKRNFSTVDNDDVVRFSLSDEMNVEAPFGESILRAAYKTFKQKELLEDSLLIYRISRAPERRVFYISTGKMRSTQVEAHLRKLKNEMRQKKIPTQRAGKDQVESVYDPQSMQEDYFFAVGEDGKSSRVETLPGGQGLGQLDDLQYFFAKMWRGMRIPDSYMNNMLDGGGAVSNDGKVGIAYMQEIKFSQYIERLQRYIEHTLDGEFKRFLAKMQIIIDPTIFTVTLPSPSNFADHRELEINRERLANYGSAASIESLAVRFSQTEYLQLSPEKQALNERLLREERGLPIDGGKEDLVKIYNPDIAEEQGFEGSMGGGGFGGAPGGEVGGEDMGDMEGEMEGEMGDMEGEPGAEGEDADLEALGDEAIDDIADDTGEESPKPKSRK